MEVALEAGAIDVVTNDDGSVDVFTDQDNFAQVQKAMLANGLNPALAEIRLIASNQISLDKENEEKIMQLVEALEDLDDVQTVTCNTDID